MTLFTALKHRDKYVTWGTKRVGYNNIKFGFIIQLYNTGLTIGYPYHEIQLDKMSEYFLRDTP